MRKHILILFFSFLFSLYGLGQSGYIDNPSFEGQAGRGIFPHGWSTCNPESTPDTQPFDVRIGPSDGQTYAGLVLRGPDDPNPKNEDLITELINPLVRDSSYILSIDLAYAPYLQDNDIHYNGIPQLRILGGSDECVSREIYAVSMPVDDTVWSKYCFVITARTDITYLSFEIFADQAEPSYLIMDNVEIEPFNITGRNFVCKGSQNEVYNLPVHNCASSIDARYTGTGAYLYYSDNSIIIDFDNDATNGDLIVNYLNGSLSDPDSIMFPISIDEGLPVSGSITGANRVCQGQALEYYHTDVSNTTIYNWNYSGSGANLNVYGKDITVDFAVDAESGELTLLPQNGCGVGPEISYEITLVPLPVDAGLISGQSMVCPDQTELYHIPGITYADEYRWSYTGSGVTMNDGALDLEMYFGNNATGGYLTVTGINACGEGYTSLEFIIFMNKPPGQTGAIEGATEICADQTGIKYTVPPIPDATEYLWSFSGQGLEILGATNQVELNFLPDATSGQLTVSGKNICGAGIPSPIHQISVASMPSTPGEISGNAEPCSENESEFTIQPVHNATSYEWNFDGPGVFITNKGSGAIIRFTEHETSGALTVIASNLCGNSQPSAPLMVKATSCFFFIPNAFSPNQDGTNDVFRIRNIDSAAKLIVFNRSGKVVYESSEYRNDWDGRDLDGKMLPTDTYWYVLSVDGLAKEVKGYVFLKR